jgi:hypothetical protein
MSGWNCLSRVLVTQRLPQVELHLLALQLAIMNLLLVFDVFGKNTCAFMVKCHIGAWVKH